jgi:hypothetical protein
MVALLVSLLLAAPQAAPPRAAPTRPGLSWADAEALERKFESLVRRVSGGGAPARTSVLVTEIELNSYLNLSLAPVMPHGLSDLDVRLEQDRLGAKAVVDLDQLKGKLPPMGAFNPISYLSGRVPVELRGRFPTANGFGNVELESLRLGGYSVPISVLEQIVASATKTRENPQGVDILAPFRLPYAIKRVRLQQGKAFLDL